MKRPSPEFMIAGVDAVLVKFGDNMNDALPAYLALFRDQVLSELAGVVTEVVPSYMTALVYYDARQIRMYDLEQWLERIAKATPWPADRKRELRTLEVPVCYGGEFGPDLERVAQQANLSTAAVIEKHVSAEYRVAALGFAPGFAYLSGLDESLATPRLSTPRKSIAAGSLGIAAQQTAVYPMAGPGGWNIIGQAVMTWFNPAQEPMTPVEVGDCVVFKSVSEKEFQALMKQERAL
ncbi:MAG: 5-oxoprolinase subunit PxpB [Idiomarina sp.]|nr:5-oxoprolinase subunit PxpB [Idiomarina sp.]